MTMKQMIQAVLDLLRDADRWTTGWYVRNAASERLYQRRNMEWYTGSGMTSEPTCFCLVGAPMYLWPGSQLTAMVAMARFLKPLIPRHQLLDDGLIGWQDHVGHAAVITLLEQAVEEADDEKVVWAASQPPPTMSPALEKVFAERGAEIEKSETPEKEHAE